MSMVTCVHLGRSFFWSYLWTRCFGKNDAKWKHIEKGLPNWSQQCPLFLGWRTIGGAIRFLH